MTNMRDTGLIRGNSPMREAAQLAMYWDTDEPASYMGTCDTCGDDGTVVQFRDHPSGDLDSEPAPMCKSCFMAAGGLVE